MRAMLTMLGWLVFSLVYLIGAMGLAGGLFGAQGTIGTLAILISAVLLWGYFTSLLLSAFRRRNPTTPTNAS